MKNRIFFIALMIINLLSSCQKEPLEQGLSPIEQQGETKQKRAVPLTEIDLSSSQPISIQLNIQAISRGGKESVFQETATVELDEYYTVAYAVKDLHSTCTYSAILSPIEGDSDLKMFVYDGTEYRLIRESENEELEEDETFWSFADLKAEDTHIVFAVFGYEASNFDIEVFQECNTVNEASANLNYLKRVQENGQLSKEYIYDRLGRVAKEKRFFNGTSKRYYIWEYHGTSPLVTKRTSYYLRSNGVYTKSSEYNYVYNSANKITKIHFSDGVEFFEYAANIDCGPTTSTYPDDGEIIKLSFNYIDELCSYVAVANDGEKVTTMHDNYKDAYESIRLPEYDKLYGHNILKSIYEGSDGIDSTTYQYRYNADGYPIFSEKINTGGTTTQYQYEYDTTIPSPNDTTYVAPPVYPIDSREIALKVIRNVLNIAISKGNVLENNQEYNDYRINGKRSGNTKVTGKKTFTEQRNSDSFGQSSYATKITNVIFDNSTFSDYANLTIDGDLKFYNKYYNQYRINYSTMQSADVTKYTLTISPSTTIKVKYVDSDSGKTYEDQVKISVKNNNRQLDSFEVKLTNKAGKSFYNSYFK